jgi:hypothetical protein
VTKLGAVQEGIFTAGSPHLDGPDPGYGHVFDLRDEWREVRDRLDARLAAFEGEASGPAPTAVDDILPVW